MSVKPIRVLSEDVSGVDLSQHPAEIDITTFARRPVSEIPPSSFARDTLDDIARAIVDQGWRWGVRWAEVTVSRNPKGTRMKAKLSYGA